MQPRFYFILLALLALLGGWYAYTMTKKANQYEWDDSLHKDGYKQTSREPYGTHVLYNLLSMRAANGAFKTLTAPLKASLPIDSSQSSTYIFVGEGMYLDSASTARLCAFVEAGNTAFISSKSIPFDLMFTAYYQECEDAPWDDYSNVTEKMQWLVSDSVAAQIGYYVQNKLTDYAFHYIDRRVFCDSLPQRPLGSYRADSLVNFALFPHGRGRFLLHTTPLAFTNYQLLRTDGQAYTAQVLAHLKDGPIYWDAHSGVPEAVSRKRNERQRGIDRGAAENDLLKYVLSQPALAWAWYLLLGIAAAYVFFKAKRRQRIMPVLPKNENTSYEYINTIAHLHFRERNYSTLAVQSVGLFLKRLRERYGVAILLDEYQRPRLEAALSERILAVSQVPVEVWNSIWQQYDGCVRYQATEQMLIDLHRTLEDFWEKAK